MYFGQVNSVVEVAFPSGRAYTNPDEVELWATFRGPSSGGPRPEWRVPAFWAGESLWKVRFAPPLAGSYTFETDASDAANRDLHGVRGQVEVGEYAGSNHLFRHGRLRVAADRRHLEHADGTPFFWLADTWWMGLCKRLGFPEEFQMLAADRAAKGFNVVQVVAGLYPDMDAFDPRGEGDGGFPTSSDYGAVNPAYFDAADLRLGHLVRVGLVPCIVGSWGYYLVWAGEEKLKRFWRNLVARYAAYPVVWCVAGEATMPYYLSETKAEDAARQRRGWTELATYVRDIDPHRNPITIHPTQFGREQVEDPTVLDFEMLQTGHSAQESILSTILVTAEALRREPRMPVLVAEVNYEGILGSSYEDVQRPCFWIPVLLGACGHTYGANGIWQVNRRDRPYGPSPHGRSWGDTPWDEAMLLPGSEQLGLAKRFLGQFPWWEMRPHPEWVEPSANPERLLGPYAAGVPGRFRIVYVPRLWDPPTIKALEPGLAYRALYFDPRTGNQVDLGVAKADAAGDWRPPFPPVVHDWVVALTAS